MTASRRATGHALLVLGAAACHAPDVVVVGGLSEVTAMRAIPNRALDVLFVIDNSPSMAGKQAALAAGLSRMIDPLTRLDGGMPDLHLGVITSDMGTLGSAVAEPAPTVGTVGLGGCRARGDDGALQAVGVPELAEPFVRDVADARGVRVRNYDGELRDVLARLVQVGAQGCGIEQPLAAMRRALDNPVNAAFFRPDANLAVVILSDEDDCSVRDPALFSPALGELTSFRCFEHGVVCDPDAPRKTGAKQDCRPREVAAADARQAPLVEPIDEFVDALLATKSDPRQIMVAAIVGDPAPVAVQLAPLPDRSLGPTLVPACQFTSLFGHEIADPAVRISAFVDAFAGRSQRTSICDPDLGSALDAIGISTRQLVGDPCVDTTALIDTSPAPGVQPACEVSLVRDAAPEPSIMEPCSNALAAECYALEPDAAACPAGDQLRVRLQRVAGLADDSWLHVRCQRQM